ncbi:hypothetical protein SBI_05940 [Streptomyces bingchenggensis BCW-1]|uniref:Uncharacterized protein n=1 Tax=Streptomyces bingchenggensis (strain BCW-1) TaxID=749414 RepID=D7CGF6_STRBB|nr:MULTISPECIES: hypothetical protein [Streptomyces]ADI09060.1 hypothetical protein SBI_05940 [Streptomyces bingchenggensis BCW-1]
MSLTEQYVLDLYRAAQRGEPAPPAPRPGDWRTIRELSRYRDFCAVVEERPARGAARRTVRARQVVRARLAALFARRRATGAAAAGSADRPLALRKPLQESGDGGCDIVRRPLQCG